MENNIIQLATEIDNLGKCLSMKHALNAKLAVTQEEYIVSKNGLKPQEKKIVPTKRPSKMRLRISNFLLLIFLAIFLAIGGTLISSHLQQKKIEELKNDPGEEYIAWVNSFNEVSSFDELQEGWKIVEAAWAKQGVHVNWDYVVEVKDNLATISAYWFNYELFETMIEDRTMIMTMCCFAIVIALIPLLIVFFKNRSHRRDWKDALGSYKSTIAQNRSNEKYNTTELPNLLKEYEEKRAAAILEYEVGINEAQAQLVKVEKAIECRLHLLPKNYHSGACAIAAIIFNGRADSLKEAINVYEDDLRAERLEAIERERAMKEQMHREMMEYEVRRAADQAHQDALAQKKMMEDQIRAQERAQEKAKAQALIRCNGCANYDACGRQRGIVNCGSYRPK